MRGYGHELFGFRGAWLVHLAPLLRRPTRARSATTTNRTALQVAGHGAASVKRFARYAGAAERAVAMVLAGTAGPTAVSASQHSNTRRSRAGQR